ncbi:cell surface protein [Talaromyces proteolyticus]|uniref:Cell surface protein n=1 Tax=Talaromyces proteolyticus TaxID=1131652 RepID=A0AAD4KIA9_9EURO|nr:cell surface protein [Talaromyces proteolyticus]KAH8689093.1 cell surface protein [Talaromyces proteolyticus]
MYAKVALFALALSPLVSAHGKVAVITGDLGGNGTALGIMGAVVPGAGPNRKTEVDTTVFNSDNIRTDNDLGHTTKNGNNQLSDLKQAMAQSGDTLPQVSSGGSVQGTYHIVTTDGAGPLEALIDETATGKWSQANQATVSTQPPGHHGNIAASNNKRNLMGRMIGDLTKRAGNVNEDHDFAVQIPAGTSCTGTINGISNLCLVKVSNNNKAGPFGGVFAVQMGANSTTAKKVGRDF